jgi:hypothetical protein
MALQLRQLGCGGAIRIVVPKARVRAWAADGQQPTAVGINTSLGEPWQIVGAAGC